MIALEDLLMAHRYLYYVLSETVISDYEYDKLEKEAREYLPMDHPILNVGSSLPSSYSTYQIKLANDMLNA